VALVEAYCKENGLWHDPEEQPTYSQVVELDLSSVEPSIAGPRRPQDRVALSHAQEAFREALSVDLGDEPDPATGSDDADAESFPASDTPSHTERRRER
jgi:aconitate hydratase